MTSEKFYSSEAPEPVGNYPHALKTGNFLFLSGIGPRKQGKSKIPGVKLDKKGNIISYDIETQCHSVFNNVRTILEESGSSWENLVDITVFLTNMKVDFPTPGGRLTMLFMFFNISFFLCSKTLWKKDKIGILILHLGGLLMMIGGGLTSIFSSEGNIIIDEGSKSNFIEDYYYMELAIINTSNTQYDQVTIFDAPLLKPNQMKI